MKKRQLRRSGRAPWRRAAFLTWVVMVQFLPTPGLAFDLTVIPSLNAVAYAASLGVTERPGQ